jgi:predicted transcriptional regulator
MTGDETTISLPGDLYERLERLAASNGRSVRDLVLDALAGLAASAPPSAGEDEYSDAERDEVAARLASLGYIDE